jgi:hypothetical protein
MEDEDQDARCAGWGRGEVNTELAAALAQFASVEPRDGLEQRVLANLRGEREAVLEGWVRWWLPAVAGALALAVIVAGADFVVLKARDRGAIAISPGRSPQVGAVQVGGDAQHAAVAVKKSSERAKPTVTGKGSRSHQAPAYPAILAAQPKLEQFPSSRPLSEQEKILASYVERYPETAALVAKARAAASLQDSLAEAAEASKQSSE